MVRVSDTSEPSRLARAPGGSRSRCSSHVTRRAPVVEHRLALHDRLHLAGHAPDRPQQRVLGVVVHRRAVVLRRHPVVVVPRPDEQHVAHDDPAGRRPPARLEHHGARQVAPRRRHADVGRPEPEAPGVPPEQRPEDARGVEPRQAHPVDVTARRDERGHLAVGEEAVVRDRHGRRVSGCAGSAAGTRPMPSMTSGCARPRGRARGGGAGAEHDGLSQDCRKICARSFRYPDISPCVVVFTGRSRPRATKTWRLARCGT